MRFSLQHLAAWVLLGSASSMPSIVRSPSGHALSGTIMDAKHVVIFMQENRYTSDECLIDVMIAVTY